MQPSASNHPVVPSDQQINEWESALLDRDVEPYIVLERAFQAGADHELEACCEWLDREGWSGESRQLRAARRPKPPSLKRVALLQLDVLNADLSMHGKGCDLSQIRRALEQLDD